MYCDGRDYAYMKLIDLSVSQYIEKAADKTSMPGGGSVAALCGALASSLAVMVLKLSGVDDITWGLYDVHSEFLQENIDKDSTSFDDVLKAFKLPKNTEEETKIRSAAIQKGYIKAIDVPLSTMEEAGKVLDLMAKHLPLMGEEAFSDALIAADLARTALRGAAHTVRLNLASLKDETLKASYEKRMAQIEGNAKIHYEAIQGF